MIRRADTIYNVLLDIASRIEQRSSSGVTHAEVYFAFLEILDQFKHSLFEIENESDTLLHLIPRLYTAENSIEHLLQTQNDFSTMLSDTLNRVTTLEGHLEVRRLEDKVEDLLGKFERLEDYTRGLENKIARIANHFVGEAAAELTTAPPPPIFIHHQPEGLHAHWRELFQNSLNEDNNDHHLDAARYFMNAGGRGSSSRMRRMIQGRWPEDDTARNPADHILAPRDRTAVNEAIRPAEEAARELTEGMEGYQHINPGGEVDE